MTLQIEEGKFYRDGFGDKVGPMTKAPVTGDWLRFGAWRSQWSAFPYHDDGTMGFTKSGKGRQSLVAEWIDEPTPGCANPGPQPMTKALLLDTAKAAVAGRGLNYGKPEDNFQRIAALWNAHLDNRAKTGPVDAADVAQMMTLMKLARLQNDPSHMDSWIDIAGYAACGAEIVGATK